MTVQLFNASNILSGSFATIQDAVNAAGNGSTIVVGAGTYVEQVVVTGFTGLTIRAATGQNVTIEAPADLTAFGTTSGGRAINAVVAISASTNVVIEDISIDGAAAGASVDGPNGQFIGVSYRDSSGGLDNVDITGIRDAYGPGLTAGGNPVLSGNQRGLGVQVDNAAVMGFFMTGGSITDFQKGAATFIRADLDIEGVSVVGGGAQPIITQNGFDARNSTGSINNNDILDLGYAGGAFSYSGAILLSDNNALDVTNNLIVGANGESAAAKVVGIWLLEAGAPTSGGTISGNDISFVDEGIDVTGTISPTLLTVENNDVADTDTSDSYFLGAGLFFSPTNNANHVAEGTALTDYFQGTTGNEVFDLLGGDDFALAGDGNDTVNGGNGDDQIYGEGGNDILNGGSGRDLLLGDAGNDIINGGSNADNMHGGSGDDTFFVDNKDDLVFENNNEGHDIVFSSVTYSLRGRFVEDLTLTGGSWIRGTGNSLANTIIGNTGNNVIDGRENNDVMIGGKGDDTYYVGEAGDTVVELAGEGKDKIFASFTYSLAGTEVEDLALLGTGNFNATGNGFVNVLTGNSGNNTLNGGIGADSMSGKEGDDIYFVDNIGDNVIEQNVAGYDTIYSSVSYSLNGRFVERIILIGANNIDATGNSLDNRIIGNIGNNILFGGTGTDTITGGAGVDTFLYTHQNQSFGALTDYILDFADEDILNLSGIDANVQAAGNQAFTRVAAFTGTSGELVLSYNGGSNQTLLQADLDGNSTADFIIRFLGDVTSFDDNWVL